MLHRTIYNHHASVFKSIKRNFIWNGLCEKYEIEKLHFKFLHFKKQQNLVLW